VAFACPVRVARGMCRFIYDLGDREALTEGRRAEVVREHRSIVAALETGQTDAAVHKARQHAERSLTRWAPESGALAEAMNDRYFDCLGDGSVICVSSAATLPVEIDPARRERTIPVIARAVARGARFVYLMLGKGRPGATALCHSREWEESPDQDFAGFVNDVVGFLMTADVIREEGDLVAEAARVLRGASVEAVREFVTGRIVRFRVRSDLLEAMIRPNGTLGYVWYAPGVDYMTSREAFDHGEALPLISPLSPADSDMKAEFLGLVRLTLRKHSRDTGVGAAEQKKAVTVVDDWLRPAMDKVCPPEKANRRKGKSRLKAFKVERQSSSERHASSHDADIWPCG
jgi:hypothetical protein